MCFEFLGYLVLCFAGAYVLSMLVEAPFMNLERIIFHREERGKASEPLTKG
jgi:hypothetical protein